VPCLHSRVLARSFLNQQVITVGAVAELTAVADVFRSLAPDQ